MALVSVDGGRSWDHQPVTGDMTRAVAFTDGPDCPPEYPKGCHGHAVASTLLGLAATADGGSTWLPQNAAERGDGGTALRDVVFTDHLRGHAVGGRAQNLIVGTSDGGTTWSQRYSQLTGHDTLGMEAVAFADGAHGYALSAGRGKNKVLRTSDGGATWGPAGGVLVDTKFGAERLWDVASAEGPGCESVPEPDPEWAAGCHAWVVGNNGQIHHTADGGATWAEQRKASGARWTTERLFGVSFADAATGVAVGHNGIVLVTTDGGRSWQTRTLPGLPADLDDVSLTRDPSTGVATAVAVGIGGAIRRFEILPPPPTVTAVVPAGGSTNGGDEVRIEGTNLTGAQVVTFGGRVAVPTDVTSTALKVLTPPHAEGTVPVTVATAGGTSAVTAASQFTYVAPVIEPTVPAPPGVPTLSATATGPTEVALRFPVAPAAGAGSGPAAGYVIKQSGAEIASDEAFAAAGAVCSATEGVCPAPPGAVGDEVTHVVTGLDPETTYHFALRAAGPAGLGARSNDASATTLCASVSAAAGQVVYPAAYSLVGLPKETLLPVRFRFFGWSNLGAGGQYSIHDRSQSTAAGEGYWAYFRCPRVVTLGTPATSAVSLPLGAYRASMVGNPFSRPATVRGFDFAARYDRSLNGGRGGYQVSDYRQAQTLAVGRGSGSSASRRPPSSSNDGVAGDSPSATPSTKAGSGRPQSRRPSRPDGIVGRGEPGLGPRRRRPDRHDRTAASTASVLPTGTRDHDRTSPDGGHDYSTAAPPRGDHRNSGPATGCHRSHHGNDDHHRPNYDNDSGDRTLHVASSRGTREARCAPEVSPGDPVVARGVTERLGRRQLHGHRLLSGQAAYEPAVAPEPGPVVSS
ncbi:MAG TPA: YCF48-related protein [Acidimicrobiales bacterium]|nr:YCF48-related protein [Acidimicrobiales bacterium]